MQFTVQLFAAAVDLAGQCSLSVILPNPGTVNHLRQALVQTCPALAELLPRCAIAVNHTYATTDTLLSAGDELAVIPPISGG